MNKELLKLKKILLINAEKSDDDFIFEALLHPNIAAIIEKKEDLTEREKLLGELIGCRLTKNDDTEIIKKIRELEK